MPDMDLYRIEAGFGGFDRSAPVVLGDARDVLFADGAQLRPHGRESSRGRERRGTVGAGVGHGSGVSDLGRHRCAFGMHGVGEPAQAGSGVLVEKETVTVGAALG